MSITSLNIQAGRTSADSEGVQTITFPVPYSSVPEVFVQPRGTTASIPVVAKITRLTAVDFDVVLLKETSSGFVVSPNQAFSWLAMEL